MEQRPDPTRTSPRVRSRRTAPWVLALGLVALTTPTQAQEPRVPPEPPRKATKRLAFETPADWKARPPEGRPWVCDYDLPGGCRVNVLFYPVDVATFEERLPHRWRKADGTPHAKDELGRESFSVAGMAVNVVDLSGTFTPAEGAPLTDQRLVAARLDVAEGAFTAWLFGPESEVGKVRARYLEWIKTVRVFDRDARAGAGPGEGPVAETRFVHGSPEHGVPGPWALTGHRIGRHALARLGVTRERSWELVVTHRSPREVRYTCVLDGLLAATGCSPGKLNLLHEVAPDEEHMTTVVLHRPSKRTLTYRLKKTFRDGIRETDYADFPKAARQLEATKDEDLFEVTEGTLEAAAPVEGPGDARATRTVRLEAVGESKIAVIKVVREITGLGLKDAKDLVESKLPAKVKGGLSPEDAESAKRKLEAVGARASLE